MRRLIPFVAAILIVIDLSYPVRAAQSPSPHTAKLPRHSASKKHQSYKPIPTSQVLPYRILDAATPEPTNTLISFPTPTPSPTPKPTPSPKPTAIPKAIPTPAVTATIEPTATLFATASPRSSSPVPKLHETRSSITTSHAVKTKTRPKPHPLRTMSPFVQFSLSHRKPRVSPNGSLFNHAPSPTPSLSPSPSPSPSPAGRVPRYSSHRARTRLRGHRYPSK